MLALVNAFFFTLVVVRCWRDFHSSLYPVLPVVGMVGGLDFR
jgi:hypothetical protein